jgi:ribonuclease BN (tRNA processing enzyme)
MKLKVLGCAGGESPNFRATAFLLNGTVLIDAGSVTQALSVEAQKRIDHVLITHAHLDHIKDLGFILDNTFGTRLKPLQVAAPPDVIKNLRDHIFNWIIWPDFSVLPDADNPVMDWVPLEHEHTLVMDGLTMTACAVNHPGNAYGYLIEDKQEDISILVTGDTATTDEIWDLAFAHENLVAVFVDVAFPDRLQELAGKAGHFTPQAFAREMKSFPRTDLPFYIYHLKPFYHKEVVADIQKLGIANLHVVSDDDEYHFNNKNNHS